MGNKLDATNRLAQHSSRATQRSDRNLMSQQALVERVRTVVPWLDRKTSDLVVALVAVVAAKHPEVQAAILFGSMARHEERLHDDPHPSDVDLLLLVTPDPVRQRLPYAQQLALWESIGDAQYRNSDAPREVEVTLVESTLADWDELFVANVAHDGILLWMRDASTPEKALTALPVAWRHLAPALPDRVRR